MTEKRIEFLGDLDDMDIRSVAQRIVDATGGYKNSKSDGIIGVTMEDYEAAQEILRDYERQAKGEIDRVIISVTTANILLTYLKNSN